MNQRLVIVSTALGVLLAFISIFSFVTGAVSLPALFQTHEKHSARDWASPRISLDLVDARTQRVFLLQPPLPFGPNNSFLADRVLVTRLVGEGETEVSFLQCDSDRQCKQAERRTFPLRADAIEFLNQQVLLVGPSKYDPSSPTDKNGPFFNLVSLVRIDVDNRVTGETLMFFDGCWLADSGGALEHVSLDRDNSLRMSLISFCTTLGIGREQSRIDLPGGNYFGRYELTGRFNGAGELELSAIEGSVHRDE